MTYCTKQDLVDEFTEAELIQLTDVSGLGVVDDTAVEKAIARADRKINRYLGGSNELPVDNDSVTDLACDIARYYLYADSVPELVEKRFYDALKELEKIAARLLALSDSSGAETVGEAALEFSSSTSVFGRDA